RLLIYTDGAARGNPGESGAGVVLKTPEGEEVGRFGRYLGKKTNNHAEYEAVLLGLNQAREFGAREITILSDSDLLVRQLLGEYRVRAKHLKELFEKVKELFTLFDKHQIKRIGREKNIDADSMANRAIDELL
ncbi:MAG: ribonuclease HI family protein, partial [Myxococcota bacterium]